MIFVIGEHSNSYRKLKENDLTSFKRLYEKYAPGVIFYARKFVDNHTAEDMVHDVFLKLWNRDKVFIIEEGFGSYLFRAVQNSCLDYLKRQTIHNDYLNRALAELKIEELTYGENPVTDIIVREKTDEVYRAIKQLPEKCREVFVMAYVEEKKNAEIAEQLHISIRTVEAQRYKALKILRKILTTITMLLTGL